MNVARAGSFALCSTYLFCDILFSVCWSSCESSAAIGVNNQYRPIALQRMLLDCCQAFLILLALDMYASFAVFYFCCTGFEGVTGVFPWLSK
jgi:hypothetical protein